ncbi:MAG: SRPBCC family protein [Bryobacteraceae bacterium]
MAVKVENNFQVPEPIGRVWELLSDPAKVAVCVPGARLTGKIDDETFTGTISVKVGPSVSEYKGQLHIDKLDPEAHEIELSGKGQDVRGKGSASMKMTGRLAALPDGGTGVFTVSEVTVIGILAQLGGRMIQDVSSVMFKEFVKRFQQQLKQGPGVEAPDPSATVEPVQAVRVVGQAIGEVLGRPFRRKPEGPDESSSDAKS